MQKKKKEKKKATEKIQSNRVKFWKMSKTSTTQNNYLFDIERLTFLSLMKSILLSIDAFGKFFTPCPSVLVAIQFCTGD